MTWGMVWAGTVGTSKILDFSPSHTKGKFYCTEGLFGPASIVCVCWGEHSLEPRLLGGGERERERLDTRLRRKLHLIKKFINSRCLCIYIFNHNVPIHFLHSCIQGSLIANMALGIILLKRQ